LVRRLILFLVLFNWISSSQSDELLDAIYFSDISVLNEISTNNCLAKHYLLNLF